jgi:hypothetical protein
MNYDKLAPGLYIQHGSAIKRIGEQGDPFAAALAGHNYNEPERLAAAVGWVFIALNKRTTQMKELYQYSQWINSASGNELDELPFAFKINREMPRIDYALQLHGQAYLFKQRRGRRLVGVRWLDPSTIQPDPSSAEVVNGGARWSRYMRTDPITYQRQFIDANDVIHFIIPGQRELEPGTPAGLATKTAANILLGMGEMFSTFYENNALPVMLVEVPAATSNEDRDSIKSAMWRVFNPRRGSRENRTVGVREGVKITPLSINPESLDAIPLEDSQIRQIVTAHDIPYEIVATSANYAVSQDRRRDFVGSIVASFALADHVFSFLELRCALALQAAHYDFCYIDLKSAYVGGVLALNYAATSSSEVDEAGSVASVPDSVADVEDGVEVGDFYGDLAATGGTPTGCPLSIATEPTPFLRLRVVVLC